jgi:hypothetical protein
MLRQLKGAPLSVYLACQIVRQVVSRDWLCEQTGYTEHAVTRALGYLTEHNYLARVTGGWMIALGAVQLPLMASLPGGEGDDLDPEKRDKSLFENEKRDKSLFPFAYPLINNNNDSIESNLIDSSLTLTLTSGEKRDKSLFSPADGPDELLEAPGLSAAEVRARLKVLGELGIFGHKAKAIAEDHHITVEDMRAHVLLVKAEDWERPLGMAIYRLLSHQPAPDLQENGHVVGCRCDVCKSNDFRRYDNGAFSDHSSDDEDNESLCIWQADDLERGVFPSSHDLAGKYRKLPHCGNPVRAGSDRWCEEHYEIGVKTFDTGMIDEAEDGE